MNHLKLSRLKILSFVLGGVGLIIAGELQKREIREAVDEYITEHEALNKPSDNR